MSFSLCRILGKSLLFYAIEIPYKFISNFLRQKNSPITFILLLGLFLDFHGKFL